MFPSPNKLDNKNRLILLSLLNLLGLGYSLYLVLDFLHVLGRVVGIKYETVGITLGNLIISLPFCKYNFNLA